MDVIGVVLRKQRFDLVPGTGITWKTAVGAGAAGGRFGRQRQSHQCSGIEDPRTEAMLVPGRRPVRARLEQLPEHAAHRSVAESPRQRLRSPVPRHPQRANGCRRGGRVRRAGTPFDREGSRPRGPRAPHRFPRGGNVHRFSATAARPGLPTRIAGGHGEDVGEAGGIDHASHVVSRRRDEDRTGIRDLTTGARQRGSGPGAAEAHRNDGKSSIPRPVERCTQAVPREVDDPFVAAQRNDPCAGRRSGDPGVLRADDDARRGRAVPLGASLERVARICGIAEKVEAEIQSQGGGIEVGVIGVPGIRMGDEDAVATGRSGAGPGVANPAELQDPIVRIRLGKMIAAPSAAGATPPGSIVVVEAGRFERRVEAFDVAILAKSMDQCPGSGGRDTATTGRRREQQRRRRAEWRDLPCLLPRASQRSPRP